MNLDRFTKLTLVLITVLLGLIVLRNVAQPAPVRAQIDQGYPFYIEPGFTMLRKPDGSAQLYGKVVIDMRSGDIWGFPTVTQSSYPVDVTQSKPPKSSPMYLGRFMFNEAVRPGGGM